MAHDTCCPGDLRPRKLGVVIKGLLVVIHVFGGRIIHKEFAAKLQQVIGSTGLVLSSASKSVFV